MVPSHDAGRDFCIYMFDILKFRMLGRYMEIKE